MYIKNIETVKGSKYYCGRMIGNYLIKKGIPLLSRDGNKMVFANTKKLQGVLFNMPVYLKVLKKAGVING